jgi:hypothetical protein
VIIETLLGGRENWQKTQRDVLYSLLHAFSRSRDAPLITIFSDKLEQYGLIMLQADLIMMNSNLECI